MVDVEVCAKAREAVGRSSKICSSPGSARSKDSLADLETGKGVRRQRTIGDP